MQKSTTKGASKNASPAPAAETNDKQTQQKHFDAAMELFHQRDFAKALPLFQKAASGPLKELLYAAKQHALMCEKRLAKPAVQLETAEDYYNYGVSLYNQGRFADAQSNLEKALSLSEGDHIHYALALALGMNQDLDGAVRHLERAIALEARNRNAALNDPDFQELLQHAPIKELLTGTPAA